ncbi:hypothetical protein BU26DRAFT_18157 [Trematosphaeria pertusa]|uniref:Uncharacterized protein n=1 Tax=Trematosphaeria pertusa TaxID=390896 RepID=A0A6A6J164_9PLEO|nr:uncharacterized protein BU26DRAFT_18157 [Trematosphaeria pertusa]KAF2256278.1 hypothetical protein BU26DRAFT_18157 [Trematosphaeria pertusa]
MAEGNGTTDTVLLATFGVLSLIAAVAGIHYRDSLCGIFCRQLRRAWADGFASLSSESYQDARNYDEEQPLELHSRMWAPAYFDHSLARASSASASIFELEG